MSRGHERLRAAASSRYLHSPTTDHRSPRRCAAGSPLFRVLEGWTAAWASLPPWAPPQGARMLAKPSLQSSVVRCGGSPRPLAPWPARWTLEPGGRLAKAQFWLWHARVRQRPCPLASVEKGWEWSRRGGVRQGQTDVRFQVSARRAAGSVQASLSPPRPGSFPDRFVPWARMRGPRRPSELRTLTRLIRRCARPAVEPAESAARSTAKCQRRVALRHISLVWRDREAPNMRR